VVTFMVRLTRGSDGRLRGTVERVRTGEKERFTDADGIGGVIERMLQADHDNRRPRRRPRERP
jgi:hypothetical protein